MIFRLKARASILYDCTERIPTSIAILFALWLTVGAMVQEVLALTSPLKVDHATICGSELGSMQQAFAENGLKTDYGGPHANGVTHMAQLGFDDGSYLELIAPQKPGAVKGSDWANFMAGNAGACAWAVGVGDIASELARLRGSEVDAEGPFPGGRKRPDGTILHWETARLGRGTPGAMLPFLIQDKTPRTLRVQPSASVKGSGLTGIAIVILGVNDLDRAARLFQRAYGWPAPEIEQHKEFGAKMAHFAGTPVVLATPLNKSSWLARRLERFGESPIGLLLGANDVGPTVGRFRLSEESVWFGEKVYWFSEERLPVARLGVVAR